jgi:hypothetical protein
MFGLAPAQADLQGDSRLTLGCAGPTIPAPIRRDGVSRL